MSRSNRRKKHESEFKNALRRNNQTFNSYYTRLLELSLTCFSYDNLPLTIDKRAMELALLDTGKCVIFKDDVIGLVALPVLINGNFDIYGNPVSRTAYSEYNHYRKKLNPDNSVIIYNNYLRQGDLGVIDEYANRLYDYDRIIDVNVRAQKTPVLLKGSDKQQLSLKQLYMQYDGNIPFIFGDKGLDSEALTVLKTDAPYISDKIYTLKQNYWNEVLTYLGIANIQTQKKERMISDEVLRGLGGTFASRASRLFSRVYGFDKVNEMFNTDIKVEFNDNIDITLPGTKEGNNGEIHNDDKNNL